MGVGSEQQLLADWGRVLKGQGLEFYSTLEQRWNPGHPSRKPEWKPVQSLEPSNSQLIGMKHSTPTTRQTARPSFSTQYSSQWMNPLLESKPSSLCHNPVWNMNLYAGHLTEHTINIRINPTGDNSKVPDKSKCKTPLERDFHNPQKGQSLIQIRSQTKITTQTGKKIKLSKSLQYNKENYSNFNNTNTHNVKKLVFFPLWKILFIACYFHPLHSLCSLLLEQLLDE